MVTKQWGSNWVNQRQTLATLALSLITHGSLGLCSTCYHIAQQAGSKWLECMIRWSRPFVSYVDLWQESMWSKWVYHLWQSCVKSICHVCNNNSNLSSDLCVVPDLWLEMKASFNLMFEKFVVDQSKTTPSAFQWLIRATRAYRPQSPLTLNASMFIGRDNIGCIWFWAQLSTWAGICIC